MTRTELVDEILAFVERHLSNCLATLPLEDRRRLDGLELFVRALMGETMQGVWGLIGRQLQREAEREAGACPGCGRPREQRPKPVEVKVLGLSVSLPCTYFYCRDCHRGESPVRRWLGVEQGSISLELERAVTDLRERMTFGDAVDSLQQQHGQELDRTQAERLTYRVAAEAEVFLAERRTASLEALEGEQRTCGVEQLLFTADGGAVPVGELERPAECACTTETPRTPVRGLPKGTRTIEGREARLMIVGEADKVTERVVDAHIAPLGAPQVSGERMLAAAAQAGLGDQTKIHGVFDMGTWIHTQFEEQFHAYQRTAGADICHVTEYLSDAGRELWGPEQAGAFGMAGKRRLLAGEVAAVLAELQEHRCDGTCITDERGGCVVHAAARYLKNHREYLNYPPLLAQELPIGSGEAESGIRHLLKKRLDVAGAWTEDNAKRMLALISVRASGLWDEFWRWRRQRDVTAWHRRQRGELRPRFRGRARTAQVAAVPPASAADTAVAAAAPASV